jgi:2-iminobutanoate/2-iminopropanoate deaminase
MMQNLKAILKASQSDLSSVINVVVYLKNMNRYAEFDKIYFKYFSAPYPSRSYRLAGLAGRANIETSVLPG